MISKKLIALDADGVLLDYHAAYRQVWQKAFGMLPALKDQHAYWPWERWDVPRLSLERRLILKAAMDETFWTSIPALPGVKDACHQLVDAGYELVCVSALDPTFQECRLANLVALGLPFTHVIATSTDVESNGNPKAKAIAQLSPAIFVDDYAPYFRDLPSGVHCALVTREPNGSPNVGDVLELANSKHPHLPSFADWLISHFSSPQFAA